MSKINFQRQIDIFNPEEIIYPFTLIGCGGIGSPTALILAKMGIPDLLLMDPDKVENHNLPNQLFRISDINKNKVDACKEIINQFTDCRIKTISKAFDGTQQLSGVVISGVDSMKARKLIWEKIKYNLDVPLYIDGRLGAEIVQVFTIRPSQIEDIELYEKFLFPEEKVAQLPCTAKAIIYTGFEIGSMIALQIKKWLKKETYSRRISFDLKTLTIVKQ